jgi:hypothetical protein
MNAFQPQTPPQQPEELRRIANRTQRRQRRHSYQAVAGEMTARLAVNLVLCTAAIAGLVRLVPYHLEVQAQLRQVRTEVKRTEKRVEDLRGDFGNTFGLGQANSVPPEYTYRVDPNQRPVWLQEPTSREDN